MAHVKWPSRSFGDIWKIQILHPMHIHNTPLLYDPCKRLCYSCHLLMRSRGVPRAAIHEKAFSHDHATVLFELSHDAGQELHDQLLYLIVLSLALSLALALPRVLLLAVIIFLLSAI